MGKKVEPCSRLEDFREVWLIHWQLDRAPGELPTLRELEAREWQSGRSLRVQQTELANQSAPPYPLGEDTLFVTYDAPAVLGGHLSLGWPMPARILDLHAEFRCLNAGLIPPEDYSLADALEHFGKAGEGVEGLRNLLEAMLPDIDLPRAILVRGRYTVAVARMESVGVPIDPESLARLREGWDHIQDALISRVDRQYHVYDGRKFNARRWRAWLRDRNIPWPRQGDGNLDLRLEAFRDMARAYPEVRPIRELRASLEALKPFRLAVGGDGRDRCSLRPFASKTGRNQPRNSMFIFGPAKWVRGLIKPAQGMALGYVDYEQQEFGIAAALSGDASMMQAYQSGDPYLAFAKQAGGVPPDATKASHSAERELYKRCTIAVQYGMGARTLATWLRLPTDEATRLLAHHRQTYPTFWRWSLGLARCARKMGHLRTAYGWRLQASRKVKHRSIRNFPVQAHAADMLRLACIILTEQRIRVCAPVHDALLIEASDREIEKAVEFTKQVMEEASSEVLRGFRLRTEHEVVRFPDRYVAKGGEAMWELVFGLLEGV